MSLTAEIYPVKLVPRSSLLVPESGSGSWLPGAIQLSFMQPLSEKEIREAEEQLGGLKAPAFFRQQQKLRKQQPAIDEYIHGASGRLSAEAENHLLYTSAVIRKLFADHHPAARKISANHIRIREHKNVHWTVLLQEAHKDKQFFSSYPQPELLRYIVKRTHASGLSPAEAARVLVRLKSILDVLVDSVRLSPAHAKPDADAGYEVRVSLSNLEPEVWRKLLVPASCTLLKLHDAVQAVMGWNDRHLHFFRLGDMEFGTCDPREDLDLLPEDAFRLHDLAHGRRRLVMEYVYDTGDNWSHLLEIRPVHLEEPLNRPVLAGGEKASPLEDCGGPAGYRAILSVLADPHHPQHRRYMEDYGEGFDPDLFDPREAESRLRRIRFTASKPRPQRV